MKKFLRNLALVCATLFAYQTANSQTVAVTADLKTMFGGAAATKTQVCLSLVDGNGNQLSNPRTSGGVIVPTATQCVLPDGSGHVATTAIANDQITPSGSVYSVTYLYNGRSVHGDTYQFLLADGTENLNTKTGITTSPIVPTPTGDNTYLRLDGGNTPTAGINFGLFTDIFGIEKITETVAPTCAVGFDLLWADSTAHRLKECDNNGSPVQIVHSGGDVNTSDQVTATHLAAALPVNQGGTGVTTAQGNGSKVQLATGTTTTNDFISYDANGNAVDSGKVAPSGAVVGDTDTQNIKNKTLTIAGSGNNLTLLNTQGPIGALVGNSTDQTVYTFTIPANTIQAGKCFRIKVVGFHSTGATNTTYKIIIGSTTTASVATTSGNTGNWKETVCNAAGVQNSQYYEAEASDGTSGNMVNTFGTTAENFANAITVKFTFNVANTDQYTGKVWLVDLNQ